MAHDNLIYSTWVVFHPLYTANSQSFARVLITAHRGQIDGKPMDTCRRQLTLSPLVFIFSGVKTLSMRPYLAELTQLTKHNLKQCLEDTAV